MSNIIDKIRISGVTYTISGSSSGGNPTVELTQAEYDALVESGTVQSDTYYIITDAQAGDLTQYWTSAQTQSAINAATSGKVNTSSVVSSVTSASTDSEIPTAKAVYDAVGQGGGGGTTYTAGRGIDITNDTISVSLPISAGTGVDSVLIGFSNSDNHWMPKATAKGAIAAGAGVSAMSECSFAFGYHSKTTGSSSRKNSFAHGYNSIANGSNSHAEGTDAIANGYSSHAEGKGVLTNNEAEHSQGQYNNSVSASTTFGDSGNTLFSVGNGTADNARHNAFEIRQNGDIYLSSGGTDIKLQDHLGGGGGGGKAISAGTNISITTGETADTINCTLPITVQTQSQNYNNLLLYDNESNNVFEHDRTSENIIFGSYNSIGSPYDASTNNIIIGNRNTINQGLGGVRPSFNFFVGDYNNIGKNYSENASHTAVFGTYLTPKNSYEYAFGKYNNSVTSSTTFGDSGNTLFSVGNGTADNARHNAFEIRQNGDIYANNGTSDVKLQDYLQIKVVKLTQSAYDALSPNYDSNTLYIIKD